MGLLENIDLIWMVSSSIFLTDKKRLKVKFVCIHG